MRDTLRIEPADEAEAIIQWRAKCDSELDDPADLADLDVVRDILAMEGNIFRPFVRVRVGRTAVLIVTDPNMMHAVLKHPRGRTPAESPLGGLQNSRDAGVIIGECLLTVGPAEHTSLKKALAPIFSSDHCQSYLGQLCELADGYAETICKAMSCPVGVSLIDPIGTFVVEAATSILMGVDCCNAALYRELNEALTRASSGPAGPEISAMPLADGVTFQCARNDSMLALAMRDRFSESTIQAMAKFLLFAGVETVSSLAMSLMWTLGSNAGIRYQAEISEKPDCIERVIDESLRLFPPAIHGRQTLTAIRFGDDLLLPKDTEIRLHHFFAQRDSRRWAPDPEAFNPARHTRRQPFGRTDTYAFSGGATPCLGALFARTQVRAIVTAVARRGRWESIGPGLGLRGDYIIRPAAHARIRSC